jgi:hypothetical protein
MLIPTLQSRFLHGGGHDLSDNIGRGVELIEVTANAYREVAE